MDELKRIDAEIAKATAALRSGEPSEDGLLLWRADWISERRLLVMERDEMAAQHIRDLFEPHERVSLVFLDRQPDAKRPRVVPRLALASSVAGDGYQRWLRHMNASRYDVYIGMNPVKPEATGRTKDDIAAVKHLYLDFDDGGRKAVDALIARPGIPPPSFIVQTSPEKYQVIWKAEGFDAPTSERLLRGLARESGADVAVTDVSRVLRLPGFNNWKREEPHFVTVERRQAAAVRPGDFPAATYERGRDLAAPEPGARIYRPASQVDSRVSQSEKDWGWVLRRLERGDSPETVKRDLAERRADKPDPKYYADRTLQNAVQKARGERKDWTITRGAASSR
jgi:hypothetical protein